MLRIRGEKGVMGMSPHHRRWSVLACTVGLAALLSATFIGMSSGRIARVGTGPQTEVDRALEWTREQVKMLDQIYKNAVVSITKRYVGTQDEQPAIMVAQ